MDHPRTSAIPPPPPFRVSADALVCRAIHGSSLDKCNTPPPPFRVSADALVCQAIHGSSLDKCNTPTPPFRVSTDALVCRAIHGSSPDKCNTPPPFQSIRGCPSMSGHPWIIPGQVQYPPLQSIRGCPSMSGHPWIIPGQVQYPHPLSESTDALVCRAIHGSSPDKCNTPPPPFQSIRGCPSMSGHPWIICVTLLLSRCLQSSFYTKIKAYCCVDHKGIKCRRENVL